MEQRTILILLSALLLAGCIGGGGPSADDQALADCDLRPTGFTGAALGITDDTVVNGTLLLELRNTQTSHIDLQQLVIGNTTRQLSAGIGPGETTIVNATIQGCREYSLAVRYATDGLQGTVNGSIAPIR